MSDPDPPLEARRADAGWVQSKMAKRTSRSNGRKDERSAKIATRGRSAAFDGPLPPPWDLATFEGCLARCEAKAYRLAVQLTYNEAAARDIVQEALSTAWQHVHELESRPEVETWVYRSTVKAALEQCHPAQRRRDTAGDDYLVFTMTAKSFLLRAKGDMKVEHPPLRRSAANCRRLRKIVDSLPRGQRAVFILCDLEEMSVGEVGRLLGSSAEQLEERLHTARAAVLDAIRGPRR